MTLPAWDQSDGVLCKLCGGDATLCACDDERTPEEKLTRMTVYAQQQEAEVRRLREQSPQFARLPSFAAWVAEHDALGHQLATAVADVESLREVRARLESQVAAQAQSLDKFKDLYAEGLSVGQKLAGAELARYRAREQLVQALLDFELATDEDPSVYRSVALAKAVRDFKVTP